MKNSSLSQKMCGITGFIGVTLLLLLIAGYSKSSTAAEMMSFPKSVKIGSAPGAAFAVTEGLCSFIKKDLGIPAVPYSGSGATDRLIVLVDKLIDLTMLSNDTIRNAFEGKGVFQQRGKLPVRIIMGVQVAPIHMATWHGTGIKGVKDARGKRMMFDFVTAPFNTAVGDRLLEFHGMTRNDVKVQRFSTFKDTMNALRERTTDLLVHPGSVGGSSYWMELCSQTDIDFISFTEEERKFVVEKEPYFIPEPVIVPAGVYKGLNKDVLCVGFMNTYIARADTNDEFIYKTMKILLDDVQLDKPGRFIKFHSDGGSFTIKRALWAAGNAPFHAAAVKYYKERGVWTDALERTQRSLLAQVGESR